MLRPPRHGWILGLLLVTPVVWGNPEPAGADAAAFDAAFATALREGMGTTPAEGAAAVAALRATLPANDPLRKRGFCPSCGARRMAESARHLVEEVFGPRPVRQWVLSFPYPLRFLFASKPEAIGPVLALVHRVIAGWLADQAGVERARAQCGAVTLIQRFGSALNLNVHFHMLWLDGVYEELVESPPRKPRLHRTRAPTTGQLTQLADTIAHRVCRHLTRKGWLEGEEESVFLTDSAGGDDGMDALRMSSITYRIATGKSAGRKVVTLQTLPGDDGSLEGDAGKVGGFSLHAGVAAEAHESHKLEKLCRYITRPAISEKRLSISSQGKVRYELKTPWRNGTTHVEWDSVGGLNSETQHPYGA